MDSVGSMSILTPLIQPLFVPFLYWTLASLGTILSVWTTSDRIQDEADSVNPAEPYDFIIVGAGSAGCLVANRLSRYYSVLLIEAGGEPNPLQFIPQFSLFFTNFQDIDWMHRTVPQKYGTLLSVNGESSWSQGKGLGGTGTLNYMIHLRGHKLDFDNWARLTGDSSWSWEGVLPFFKSYENYEVPGDPVNHGYDGDLRIEAPDFPPSAHLFVKAAEEYGFPNVDLNAPFKQGFDIIRYPSKHGIRQAPYKAFLEPIRFRPSLTILKFALVTKVYIDENNVAYGVEYDRHGFTRSAFAHREVIISAGTVGSPKILMLSGVGPRDHLKEMKIPVVKDLPVGEGLADHLAASVGPFFIRSGLGNYLDRDITIGQFIKYFTLGRGRLTSSLCEATGLWSSSYAKQRGETDWPDLQVFSYGLTGFKTLPSELARTYGLKLDDLERYLKHAEGRDSLFMVVTGSRPFSRGYIRLGGSSPYDKPTIDPNYLSDKGGVDLKVLLEGVKTVVNILENTTTGGVELGARFTNTMLPGCEHFRFRSNEYWTCYIRRFSLTIHHPAGSCSMGKVVDTQLKVKGIKGLRVIDASIQPQVVTTNTQASTLMIAEKGANMIINYWKSVDNTRNQDSDPVRRNQSDTFETMGLKNVSMKSVRGSSQIRQTPSNLPSIWNDSQLDLNLTKVFNDLKNTSEKAKRNYEIRFENYDEIQSLDDDLL